MSFWQFLTNAFDWIADHATRGLAVTLGLITTLVSTGIIPEHQLKYYAATIAVLNYLRGQFTAGTVAQAKAVLSQNPPSTPPEPSGAKP
jgi:hypothetical protein